MHLCRSFCHFYTPTYGGVVRGFSACGAILATFFTFFFLLQQRIGFLYGFLTSWLAFLTYDLTICIKGSRIVTD